MALQLTSERVRYAAARDHPDQVVGLVRVDGFAADYGVGQRLPLVRGDIVLRLAFVVSVAVLSTLLPCTGAGAQTLVPGEQVRVTVQQQGAIRRETGWLISVTLDTIMLRLSPRDSQPVARADIIRLEHRRRHVSIGKSTGVWCAVGAATLGGLGLAARDPDSPGIERTRAVVGGVIGCVAGGTMGLIGGIVACGPWERVNPDGLAEVRPAARAAGPATPMRDGTRPRGYAGAV